MGCTGDGGCSSGGCSGCCISSAGNGYETAINSTVELEIYYSLTEDKEAPNYVLKNIYCLTNIQTRELRVTGLEGKEFESLDKMGQQIIEHLIKTEDPSCESLTSADIVYISDDI